MFQRNTDLNVSKSYLWLHRVIQPLYSVMSLCSGSHTYDFTLLVRTQLATGEKTPCTVHGCHADYCDDIAQVSNVFPIYLRLFVCLFAQVVQVKHAENPLNLARHTHQWVVTADVSKSAGRLVQRKWHCLMHCLPVKMPVNRWKKNSQLGLHILYFNLVR